MGEVTVDFLKNDRFASMTGIESLEVKPGYSRCKLVVSEKHFNAVNVVQGGAIFTLADYAFALASNSRGQLALAINVNISFLKSVSGGILYAEAIELAEPGRLGSYDVKVSNDNGELVAQFNGMVYRKREAISFL